MRKDQWYVKMSTGIVACFISVLSQAQSNPFFYFRISSCNNCKTTVYLNESVLVSGTCKEVAWRPLLLNAGLGSKNKLRFELGNEKPGDYYGNLTFELLKVDSAQNIFKRFYFTELKLEDFDRFQLSIDNLLKRQDWVFTNPLPGPVPRNFVQQGNRKDSLDYFFSKQDRFYLTVTTARHAAYSVSLNNQLVMEGKLHISAFQDAYAFANYPYFFLNSFDKSSGRMVVNYKLQPMEAKREAYLELLVYHYTPGMGEPQVIAISKIDCPVGETRAGEFDLTETLSRNGFFNQ